MIVHVRWVWIVRAFLQYGYLVVTLESEKTNNEQFRLFIYNNMTITFKKGGKKIETLEQWAELGHPKSAKQWKSGRSAKEMARFAIEHTKEFESIIRGVLKECSIVEQDFICEPEAIASLGKGMKRGGCRNHDLLLIGKDCVIGVEAKVSEHFGETLEKELKEQSKKKDGSKVDTRAYQLLQHFVASDNQYEKAKNIGYQLFTATRGTICSAHKKPCKRAVMLVIVFTGEVLKEPTYEENCRKNDDDYNAFLEVVGADVNGKIIKKIEKKEIECWIKKVKINISLSYTKL